jgi:hypothetical protein
MPLGRGGLPGEAKCTQADERPTGAGQELAP